MLAVVLAAPPVVLVVLVVVVVVEVVVVVGFFLGLDPRSAAVTEKGKDLRGALCPVAWRVTAMVYKGFGGEGRGVGGGRIVEINMPGR